MAKNIVKRYSMRSLHKRRIRYDICECAGGSRGQEGVVAQATAGPHVGKQSCAHPLYAYHKRLYSAAKNTLEEPMPR